MKYIFLIIFLFIDNVTFSQTESNNILKASYNHTNTKSYTQKDDSMIQNVTLLIDEDLSFYTYLKDRYEEYKSKVDELKKNPIIVNKDIVIDYSPPTVLFYVYHANYFTDMLFANHTSKKYQSILVAPDNLYYYENELPDFDWKIIDSTKNILNYKVQKAIGSYGGISYEAWFTLEIETTAGPWKFNGLPGLILEAYDSNKEMKFIATDVKYIEAPMMEFARSQYIKLNEKEFSTLKNRIQTQPYSFKTNHNVEYIFVDETGMEHFGQDAEILIKRNIEFKKNMKMRKPMKYFF